MRLGFAAALRFSMKTSLLSTLIALSPMPAGLLGGLTAQQIADLLAFVRQAQ